MSTEESKSTEVVVADKAAQDAVSALVTIKPERFATEIFKPFLADLKKSIKAASGVEYDITTTIGMATAKRLRKSFRDIRTCAEAVRKERKAPIIEIGKLLDARYKEIEALISPHEDKYDAEIEAEDARKEAEKQRKIEAERVRIEAIENRIKHIRDAPIRAMEFDSARIVQDLDFWSSLVLDPAEYDELLEDAIAAVNAALVELEKLRQRKVAEEAEAERVRLERIELERLRAAAEQRERDEAQRRATEDAARRAEQEQRDAEMAAMRAQLDAANAALKAKEDAERAAVEKSMKNTVYDVPQEEIKGAPISSTGHYYSTTTFRDDGKPIFCNPDGTRSVFCDVDVDSNSQSEDVVDADFDEVASAKPQRPSDEDILFFLSEHYGATRAEVAGWLRDMDLRAYLPQAA